MEEVQHPVNDSRRLRRVGNKLSLTQLHCLRCNHDWHPSRPIVPRVCPKCKSPYWNIPRKEAK